MIQPALDYIIAQLRQIHGVENVYDCLPLASNKRDLKDYFSAAIQGWEVANPAGEEVLDVQNAHHWRDVITIDGWQLYTDAASRQAMQRKVDAIKLVFYHDKRLGQTVAARTPLRLLFFQTDWFYETLCHHCRFSLGVEVVTSP